MNDTTTLGLTFVALSIATADTHFAVHNSSEFAYRNFATTEKAKDNMRKALHHTLVTIIPISGAMGLMCYLATKSILWAIATFVAGVVMVVVYYIYFKKDILED